MRKGNVLVHGILAGQLIETDERSYIFEYNDDYYRDISKLAVSLTLPKTKQRYESKYLFPFFYNMLSEGVNKQLQCSIMKIDEADAFGLLLNIAAEDTVGAITIKEVKNDK